MPARIDADTLSAGPGRLAVHVDLPAALEQVVDAAGEPAGTGLMLADEHCDLRCVEATSERARLLDQAQLDAGEGPGLDAYVRDELVVTTNLAADPRWPAAARLIAAHGVGAVLCVPIHLSGLPVGSLDLHVDRRYEFDGSEIEAFVGYGGVVEAMLPAGQLRYAVDHRAPIERSIGYLMARDRLDATAAFGTLRAAARSSHRRIGIVATDLLHSGRLPGESADGAR